MLKELTKKLLQLVSMEHLKWKRLPNGIYCFNYHRIGDAKDSAFDPNVFSCTTAQFQKHVDFYQSEFEVINESKLCELIELKKPLTKKYAVITFDDGYIDNYTQAYPILRDANCPAILYIATDFISDRIIPWWDEVAWLVKNNPPEVIQKLNWQLPSNFTSLSIEQKIRSVLRSIKDNASKSIETKLVELRDVAKNTIKPDELTEEPLFMSWDMLSEMQAQGIDIGSQTCSHPILAHLDEEQQRSELATSKEILEQHIGHTIRSIAYPVGGAEAFNLTTQKLAKETNYTFAMSFIPGLNENISHQNIYSLRRFSIDTNINIDGIKRQVCKFL